MENTPSLQIEFLLARPVRGEDHSLLRTDISAYTASLTGILIDLADPVCQPNGLKAAPLHAQAAAHTFLGSTDAFFSPKKSDTTGSDRCGVTKWRLGASITAVSHPRLGTGKPDEGSGSGGLSGPPCR